jgi:hypothetical protein
MDGSVHAPAALPAEKKALGTQCRGSWVARGSLDTKELEANISHVACSLPILATSLPLKAVQITEPTKHIYCIMNNFFPALNITSKTNGQKCTIKIISKLKLELLLKPPIRHLSFDPKGHFRFDGHFFKSNLFFVF